MHSSGTNSQDSSDDSHQKSNLSDYTCTRPTFKFPPKSRLSKSVNNSVSSQSDSSSNFSKLNKRKKQYRLPPLGIFWDIENCQVPKNKSASAVVQRIREFFLEKYREAEFLVVCDVKKERPQVIQELHDSQVNLIHVASTSKNAADEKLRQSLRRFAEIYPAPSSVVLISGDINFAADLSDLRYRKKIRVILVHNTNVADALILCANEHYNYAVITEGLPHEKTKVHSHEFAFLLVTNLPTHLNVTTLKNRLNFLCNNCGGRVVDIHQEEGMAYIRFSTQDFANRAQKRIQGEDVFGNKIRVVAPSLRSYTGRKIKDGSQGYHYSNLRSLNQEVPVKDAKKYPYDAIQDCGVRPSMMDPTFGAHRRSRTPQESSGRASSEYSDDGKLMDFKTGPPVDLIISNIDPSLSVNELKKLLMNKLMEYAVVLSLNVTVLSDGSPVANIRVNNEQSARYLISQLQRQKIGQRRIVLSYAQNNSPDPEQLKAMVISILQEAPNNNMPLFRLMEQLESRYHCTVSVHELNKMKDIFKISVNRGYRMVEFIQQTKLTPSPNLSQTLVPYCTIHCANGLSNLGWCEVNTPQYLNLMIPLKMFAKKLNHLLNAHFGSMPLLSFQTCYEQECHEFLPIDSNGVPLEHLISCVSNIEIKYSGPNKSIKIIRFEENEKGEVDEESVLKSAPPSLAPNISLLCRELVDLLKTTDRCQLLLSKFIPAYHHHFGRQCHLSDYGYTRLTDLFESIPHVVQIIGDGPSRFLTLSHQAQMRRFTSDLLRVLKFQPNKQIQIDDFPSAYEKVMNRGFNPVDYGLCSFQDLLEEVPENIIVIQQSDENIIISVPKREQTVKEIMKTKQFAMEVIDILKYAPNFEILFDKFVPAYHHHFGHQCRVSDYGFTKLIELFEAIPDVAKIQRSTNEQRTISLTLNQAIKILGNQIVAMIEKSPTGSITLKELSEMYLKEWGFTLKPQTYECDNIQDVVRLIKDYVEIVETGSNTLLISLRNGILNSIKIRSWAILSKSPYCKEFSVFSYEYQSRYNSKIFANDLKQLRNVVSLSVDGNDTNYIALTDLYILAAQLYHILSVNGGSILYENIEKIYLKTFNKTIRLGDYNINSVDDIYEKFDFLFFNCEYQKNVLVLDRNLADYLVALPTQIYENEGKKWPMAPTNLVELLTPPSKVSIPKPDSPSTPGALLWTPKVKKSQLNDLDFSINLPIIENPTLLGNPFDLISPARSLFPNRNVWGKAPDPTELPMPDKLIMKDKNESNDSGIKFENSDNEIVSGACGSGVQSSYLYFNEYKNWGSI